MLRYIKKSFILELDEDELMHLICSLRSFENSSDNPRHLESGLLATSLENFLKENLK